MRHLAALLVLLSGVFGMGAAAAEDVPLPRPRPPAWIEPHSFREAAGADFDSAAVTAKSSECNIRLEKIAVLAPMPRLIGPGVCGGEDMVRLDAVLLSGGGRVQLKPAPVLRCAMAERLAVWVRDDAAPRTAAATGTLRSIDTYDDFSCRGRNRQANGKISEHGKGNAVDVRGFTLADGRFIGLTDVKAAKGLRDGLRESACARFTTVLGPGSDGYHEAHIHLDAIERRSGYRICQWDVREPPPAVKPQDPGSQDPGPQDAGAEVAANVPLPQPRPKLADTSRRGRRL